MTERYLLPPLLHDLQGNVRRAGFEFEFGNLPIVQTAEALHATLGGRLEIISPFEAVLKDSQLGRLKVERDADLLKSVRYRKWLSALGVEFKPGTLANEIETNIDSATRGLIPCEVVTDPIPFEKLALLNQLVHTLDQLGAEGTQESFIYAFGMHINPSLPRDDADTIRRILQAFLLLHAWIIDSSGVDRTRRYLTPYIDPFPQEYMELLLDSEYRPDIGTLIDDYLQHNPTRNRALDMLPIFCHLDEERVRGKLSEDEGHLVKGRPAFHYRLPDCRINQAGWSAAAQWNHWVYVENLASDEALLAELITAWRETNANVIVAQNTRWVMTLTSILAQKFFES